MVYKLNTIKSSVHNNETQYTQHNLRFDPNFLRIYVVFRFVY